MAGKWQGRDQNVCLQCQAHHSFPVLSPERLSELASWDLRLGWPHKAAGEFVHSVTLPEPGVGWLPEKAGRQVERGPSTISEAAASTVCQALGTLYIVHPYSNSVRQPLSLTHFAEEEIEAQKS